MTSTPFYLGDIVRSKSTGIEGRIASVSSRGGRILVGGGYLSVPWDDGEVITPAIVETLPRDPKGRAWVAGVWGAGYEAATENALRRRGDDGLFPVDYIENPYEET